MIKHLELQLQKRQTIWLVLYTIGMVSGFLAGCGIYSAAAADESASSVQNSVVPPGAGGARKISLSTCFEFAEQSNKELIVARRNVFIAKAAITAAGAVPNPQFNLQYGFGTPFSETLLGGTQQFGFSEVLQTAGKREKRINLAKANYRLVQLQFETLRFDVHNRVRRAYGELSAAHAYRGVVVAQRATAQQLAEIAERQFRHNIVAQTDFLQARLIVLQADIQKNEATGRIQQASTALSLLIGETPARIEEIGVDQNDLFTLSLERTMNIMPLPHLTLPPLEELIQVGVENRPDRKAVVEQIFANDRAVVLSRSIAVPDVMVGSGYVWETYKRNQGVPFQHGVYLNVTTNNPIFYQNQGEIRRASAKTLQSRRQVEQIDAAIERDVVTSYNQLTLAYANVLNFQQRILPSTDQVVKLAHRSYETGKTEMSDAIIAQQQYLETRSSYYDAVVDYQNAWEDLEQAVGLPLK